MTRLIRTATMMTVGGLLLASAAMAAVPDPTFCSLPKDPITGRASISLGPNAPGPGPGQRVASAGTLFAFDVTVKNGPLAINAVVGSHVKIDFNKCKKLHIAPNNNFPAVDCNQGPDAVLEAAGDVGCYPKNLTHGPIAYAVTGGDGIAHFPGIVGSSTNPTGVVGGEGLEPSGALCGCAEVFADNGAGAYVSIGRVFVGTPDEDNSTSALGGVDGRDLSSVIGDVLFIGTGYLNRTDFDHNGVIDGLDLGKMIDILSIVGPFNGPGCGPDGANNACAPTLP